VSLPALTLVYVHDLKLSRELLFPASMAWLLFGVGCAFFWGVGKLLRLPSRTVGALTLVGGLGNTSFVGLPMIETYYGTQGLGVGILVDQAGTYLVLSTLGILMATYYRQEGRLRLRAVVKKILTFAPFLAFICSLLLVPVTYPEWLDTLLRRLGATLVPLALASVGYQIQWKSMRSKLREVGIGLTFKLALGPAVVALVLAGFFAARGETIQITIFEAAMAPQIGAAIVALDHDLDPQLVTLMVGIGTPLSFLTLPLWWQLLQPLGQ
jgi:predicted permease